MRSASILSLALLAALTGCAGPSSFRELRGERLDRVHSPRLPEVVLLEVIANAPAVQGEPAGEVPQDRHIDQRLPVAVDRGPKPIRERWQPLAIGVRAGVGDVMVRAAGTGLNDRSGASFVETRLDTGPGAGLEAGWWDGDGDLFAGRFLNDGVEPKRANARLGGASLFPHVRLDAALGDAAVPVRVGLSADWQRLDHQAARVKREWLAFGPRVVAEPAWTVHADGSANVQVFTLVGGDLGPTWFSEEYRNGDGHDSTWRFSGEVGAGVRAAFGAWQAEVGYRLRHSWVGGTDTSLFGSADSTELQQQQVFLGFRRTF
ncbi:MAG TPA: hypothetical protein ENI87_08785 [bacterium]|nr:hypothetical protein [bacterium]